MASTESNFSVTFKVNGDLFTVRGDDAATFRANLDAVILTDLADKVLTAQSAAHEASGVAAPAVAQVQQSVAAPAQAAPAPTYQAPAPQGGVETVTDRFGNTWIYGLPDAPQLPDGRGQFVLKQGRSKAGKAYKGWFDPAKGPKPFTPGAVEADPIFVRD